MVSLNTLRTKFGVLLSIVIGGALIAFIFSLKEDVGFSGNDPEVGEVAGDDVNYSEFNAAYEDIRLLMGGDNIDFNQASQLVSEAWQSIMTDRVLVPGYEDLGLVVTAAELESMKRGDIASGVYGSIFSDPATGYSLDRVNAFIDQAKSNPEAYKLWQLLSKQARIERVSNKYMDLLRGGTYANTLALNKGVVGANNTYKGRFVVCNYSSIADSLVTVSDKDIKKYYEANLAKYEQKPYRTVSYAVFDIEATEEDKKAVEEKAKVAAALFADVANLLEYTRDESHASIASSYVSAESLSDDEKSALAAGKTFGPELRGDEWYASRVSESRNVAKSFELQHIILEGKDAKLADSLYNVAGKKGADFAALAAEFSLAQDPQAVDEVEYSQLPLAFANALVGTKSGSIVKVQSGNTIFVTKVLSAGPVARHYRLATLTYLVEPSRETVNSIHKSANEFAVKANGSVEKFNAAAKESNIITSSMNVDRGSRYVSGLPNSLEVVRWAYKADAGEVSEMIKLEDCYVVAVVTAINEDEHKSLNQVSSQIKTTLLRQKKAAMLKEKMNGATLEEIAANAEGKVEEFADAKCTAHFVQGLGVEPRVLGALATVSTENKGALLPLIEGNRGVYAVVVDDVAVAEEPQTVEAERVKVQAQEEMKAMQYAWRAINKAVNIVDNTVLFF